MRPRHRRRRPLAAAVLLPTLLSVTLLTAPAAGAAEPPPQEPGVTLRVFDVQTDLDALCTLKPGQTPNVDTLQPRVDWTTPEDFGGLADRFVAQALGYLTAPTTGTYDFRLVSDDGSRLILDDTVVVDHDGLHPPTAKDGSIQLSAGYHALRIDHFERDGGQQLSLQWRPPGATDFTLVPDSALSTDAGVVRVTAPGRKECEGGGDSPGDGLPLAGVHPGYALTDVRPAGFEPQVSAMDWFPDGRLAIATWGGSQASQGEVYVLDGVAGGTGPGGVTPRLVATGLREPMGLTIVDGSIFVSQKHELTELVDTDGDGDTDEYRTVATWPFGGNFHEFAFGLLYRDGFFYLNLSVSINYGGATTNPQPAANRGTTIKVDRATGEVSYVAGGLRTPNGIGWGPEGGIFVTDNQGDWLPSSKLVHIQPGQFYNHYTTPAGPFDSAPVTPPVLWLPQNEIANSPSTPLYLTEDLFAGQMLFGDVTYGGIQRASLEKVDGAYQGAVFRFTQGLEAGVNRISLGPDGSIYAGGLGAGGNWGQEGKLTYGLQRLTPTGAEVFDILAVRATPTGFALEYTQPLSDATAEALATRYRVRQWRYEPAPTYGGPKVDEQALGVTSATLSADRRTVTLEIPGLQEGRVVHIRSPRPFSSAGGQALWSTEAWYTLNAIPGGGQPTGVLEAEQAQLSGGATVASNHPGYTGTGFVDGYWNAGASTTFTVDAATAGEHAATLRYANGPHPFSGTKTLSLYVNGEKVRQVALPSTGTWQTWADHTETVTLDAGSNTIGYRYDEGDTANVNLDNLTVTAGAPTSRITLFDGSGLDAWESTGGGSATWPIADGSMESRGGDIRTRQSFQDFRLHVEWLAPDLPPDVTGQRRGNSGVYLQDRYEIQVLESFGLPPGLDTAAAIYAKKAPDSNAGTPGGTWQTYDITFRAARFDSSGAKTANARVTVVWNGVVVHDDVEIDGPTGGGAPEGPAAGPIRLQDHGDPGDHPRYRSIWIEPLG
jgi:hypothetical protein